MLLPQTSVIGISGVVSKGVVRANERHGHRTVGVLVMPVGRQAMEGPENLPFLVDRNPHYRRTEVRVELTPPGSLAHPRFSFVPR